MGVTRRPYCEKMNPVTVSAAYCVNEILSVGRCRSVREAADKKSLVTGGHG